MNSCFADATNFADFAGSCEEIAQMFASLLMQPTTRWLLASDAAVVDGVRSLKAESRCRIWREAMSMNSPEPEDEVSGM